MKRLASIALVFAVAAGVFSPLAVGLSARGGIIVGPSVVHAQQDQAASSGNLYDVQKASVDQHLDSCLFTNAFISGSLAGCIEWTLYYIPYSIGSWLMGISALVFDSLAGLTLSSALYSASSFIQDGWVITRDFANIFFILILLYIALSLVLGLGGGHSDPKRMIASVVAVAVLINFSFFMTSVIIDVSNTLALTFYNRIQPTDANGRPLVAEGEADSGSRLGFELKPVSIALVRAFQPQILASEEFYQSLSRNPDTNNGGQGGYETDPGFWNVFRTGVSTALHFRTVPTVDDINAGFKTGKGDVSPTIMITIFLLVGAMFLVVAYSFFIASLSLIGRLVTLWTLIIFAPFAFISRIIPGGERIGGFGWKEWWTTLISTAFAAPIYFFFLYLVARLAQSSFVSVRTLENGSFAEILIPVILSFLLLVTLLLRGTKFIKKASGEIGEMVFKAAGVVGGAALGVTGLAVGTAAGGLAVAGRSTLGKWAKNSSENQNIQNRAKNKSFDGWVARQQLRVASNMRGASFDVRQNKLANSLSSATGMNLGSFGAFSTKQTAGGFDAAVARDNERDAKIKKLLGYDKGMEEEIEKTAKKKKEKLETTQDELAQYKADKNAAKDLDAQITRLSAVKPYAGETAEAKEQREKAVKDLESQKKAIDDRLRAAVSEGKSEASLQATINTLKNGINKKSQRVVGKKYVDENGAEYTATAKHAMEDMGITDLEKAQKTVKDARFKEYLLNKAKDAGADPSHKYIHDEYDNLGNLKKFHVDPKHAIRNWKRAYEDAARDAGKAAAVGLVGGSVFGPLGSAIGAGGMALASVLTSTFREGAEMLTLGTADGKMFGGTVGSRLVEFESIHHSLEAKEGDKHHGPPASKYKANVSGPIGKLQALFSSIMSGGGGGGGHGGGHDHGHDDHGHGGGHDDHGHH